MLLTQKSSAFRAFNEVSRLGLSVQKKPGGLCTISLLQNRLLELQLHGHSTWEFDRRSGATLPLNSPSCQPEQQPALQICLKSAALSQAADGNMESIRG